MRVEIYKILKQTSGGFHSWVDSSIGRIRKPNGAINVLRNGQIDQQELSAIPPFPNKAENKIEVKLKWYQIILNFIKRLFKKW